MKIKDPITTAVGRFVWKTAEYFNINLGQIAPIVFGWMIGSAGKRINKSNNEG